MKLDKLHQIPFLIVAVIRLLSFPSGSLWAEDLAEDKGFEIERFKIEDLDAEIELDYESKEKKDGSESSTTKFTGNLKYDYSLEEPVWARYLKAGVEIRRDKVSNEEEEKEPQLTVKGREDSEEFLQAGLKRYLSNTPIFLFGEGRVRYLKNTEVDGYDPETNFHRPHILGALGTGYGMVKDVGKIRIAKKIEKGLLERGIISRKFTRKVTTDVIEVLQKHVKTKERVDKIRKILTESSLMDVDALSIDAAFEMSEIIESTFDERRAGIEVKFFLLQDIVLPDEGSHKGYFNGQVNLEKPHTDEGQISLNGYFQIRIDDPKIFTAQLQPKYSYIIGSEMAPDRILVSASWLLRYDQLGGNSSDLSSTIKLEVVYAVSRRLDLKVETSYTEKTEERAGETSDTNESKVFAKLVYDLI